MFSFPHVLTPYFLYSLFFTTADFNNALIDIENAFPLSDADRTTSLDQLKKAYDLAISCLLSSRQEKPDKQLTFLFADILRRYAQLYQSEDPEASKQILLAAFNMHSYTINLSEKCFDIENFTSLEYLKEQATADPKMFSETEQLLFSTEMDRCLFLAHTDTLIKSYRTQRLTNLAEMISDLYQCYKDPAIHHLCALSTTLKQLAKEVA